MTDPRENKLPVWARELIASERTRAALAWPTVSEPAPAAVLDSDHLAPKDIRGKTVWYLVGGYGRSEVRSTTIDSSGYAVSPASSFRRRLGGVVYLSKEDALLAAWWRECRESALAIRIKAQDYWETTQ